VDAEAAAVKEVTENGRPDVPEFRAFRLLAIFPNLSLRPWRGFALIAYAVRLDHRATSVVGKSPNPRKKRLDYRRNRAQSGALRYSDASYAEGVER